MPMAELEGRSGGAAGGEAFRDGSAISKRSGGTGQDQSEGATSAERP